jgi:N-acetylneuraminic acid mutarotase
VHCAGTYYGDLYDFDPASAAWRNLTSSANGGRTPSVRAYAGLSVAAGKLYLFGGVDDRGSEP